VHLANAWVAAVAAVAGEIVDPAELAGARVKLAGRAVVIRQDDDDTDVLYPGQNLNVTDVEKMTEYLFEGLDPSLRDELGGDTALVVGSKFGPARHASTCRRR
jgi:hypothetical protein